MPILWIIFLAALLGAVAEMWYTAVVDAPELPWHK